MIIEFTGAFWVAAICAAICFFSAVMLYKFGRQWEEEWSDALPAHVAIVFITFVAFMITAALWLGGGTCRHKTYVMHKDYNDCLQQHSDPIIKASCASALEARKKVLTPKCIAETETTHAS